MMDNKWMPLEKKGVQHLECSFNPRSTTNSHCNRGLVKVKSRGESNVVQSVQSVSAEKLSPKSLLCLVSEADTHMSQRICKKGML